MRFIFFFLLLISLNSFGQLKDYIIGAKGDTLNRVDLKGKKQGPWFVHVDDLRGERGYEEEGFFENDMKEGTWKRYSLQGIKIAVETYRWGKLSGKCLYYTYNGGLQREESWWAMDPSVLFDTVEIFDLLDPTKVVGKTVVKNEGISFKHGEWNYYDPNEGVIVKTERYQLGKIANENGEVIADDDLKPIDIRNPNKKEYSDTAAKRAGLQLKEIKDFQKKNSGKKKIKVRDGNTGN